MNAHILPDSRLSQRPDFGVVMADWQCPDGSTVRVEMARVHCANCGILYGYCPRDNTTFAFWLCNQCFEDYGAIAGTYAVPEEEFCKNVEAEMLDRFGRGLNEIEVFALAEQNRLGTALEKLARESPFAIGKAGL